MIALHPVEGYQGVAVLARQRECGRRSTRQRRQPTVIKRDRQK
ncbi:hypothetical protein [Nostoc sp. 'Lobaria pulmonaria (5183) cyanobiont']|nr:hypothetical protein [Nostoc sp. 'Lobaria pulmonaria (5183) cyanobiont']